MKRITWLLQIAAIVIMTLPLAIIPHKIALKIGEALGTLLFFLWPSRRRIAIKNLEDTVSRGAIRLASSPNAVIKEHFRNLGRSFVEVLKIYYGLGDRIVRGVQVKGIENFRKAHEKGRGVLLITGHCGNWELSGLAFGVNLGRVNGVARPINNPYLNRFIERTREKHGNTVIYKKGALKKILSALRRNEGVGILMDQSVVSSEGLAAEFLGKKDYVMKTPAIIARKTGSPVLPVFIRGVDGGHCIEIGQEIPLDKSEDNDTAVFNDTVRFSGFIEEYIRQNPSEWLWIHRRWKRIPEQTG
ncbi:MAG: lysophospholipid acyltransferase family protein [Nitrospirae bacterium]|nr:lysophospholipid acyltransferase family protein [Nitrospirota bacterium]